MSSDTVTASVIVGSLGNSEPSFVLDLGGQAPVTDSLSHVGDIGSHVSGAAHIADPAGFGSALLVDFVSWPVASPPVETPTIPGAAGGLGGDEADAAAAVAQVDFDHFL